MLVSLSQYHCPIVFELNLFLGIVDFFSCWFCPSVIELYPECSINNCSCTIFKVTLASPPLSPVRASHDITIRQKLDAIEEWLHQRQGQIARYS